MGIHGAISCIILTHGMAIGVYGEKGVWRNCLGNFGDALLFRTGESDLCCGGR